MPLTSKLGGDMGLPIRTTLDDVQTVCGYLSKKPTGSTLVEVRKVLDGKYLDGRKLSALKSWKLIEEDGRLKIADDGRRVVREESDRVAVFRRVIAEIDAYRAVVERAGHKNEFSISSTDVAAHWHKHFKDDASSSDRVLNDQAVCFFQIASGANLGSVVIGRKGKATRFEFVADAVRQFLDSEELDNSTLSGDTLETEAEVPEPKGGFPQGNQVNLSRAGASPTQLGKQYLLRMARIRSLLSS
jgi:hypothetical protein